MKNLFNKLLLLSFILFSAVFVGCKDDDKNEIINDEYEIGFTPDTLYQTAWEGTLTTYKDGNPEVVNTIKMMFTSYDYARVVFNNKNLDITFHIDKNYFSVSSCNNTDTGNPSNDLKKNFWLNSITNKRMVMRTSILDDKNYEVLDMKCIYE